MAIELTVNGTPTELPGSCSVQALTEQLDITNASGIAVAINAAVVPRSEWQTQTINEGDRVEILTATQGG